MSKAVKSFAIAGACFLTGCSAVDVYNADGTDAHGYHYYLPEPYLLVVKLPAATGANGGGSVNALPPGASRGGHSGGPASNGHGHNSNGGGNNGGANSGGANSGGGNDNGSGSNSGNQNGPDKNTGTADAQPSATSLTAFAFTSGNYQVRMLYMPDKCKEYSMVPKFNPFYSAQSSLKIQDGWMLTGVDTTVTSVLPEIISSLASLAQNTVKTLAGASQPASDTGEGETVALYRFTYDGSGRVNGVSKLPVSDGQNVTADPPKTCSAPHSQ